MACLFLDKLPSEICKHIYEYVLDFDDVPLRHATQLQPFVKKLTGTDGELPFHHKGPSKLIYTEAIKVFYDQSVISVDIELFKLANVNSPDAPGSDLSLAKRLVVRFNQSCGLQEVIWRGRGSNWIELKTFLQQVQAIFPQVSHIVVQVDEANKPLPYLFNIAEECHKSSTFHHIAFNRVGSFVATANNIVLKVQFKLLMNLWKHYTAMAETFLQDPEYTIMTSTNCLPDRALCAFIFHTRYKQGDESWCTDLRVRLQDARETMAVYFPIQAKIPMAFDDHEFWTILAAPFRPWAGP